MKTEIAEAFVKAGCTFGKAPDREEEGFWVAVEAEETTVVMTSQFEKWDDYCRMTTYDSDGVEVDRDDLTVTHALLLLSGVS